MKDINADRDASLDRLMAGALSARAGEAPDGACLDAETLAAWSDEALEARERARVEAHAADCPRCQALLAAMVRTAPPVAEARSWWRIPALGWLVPLTVAATALVIWVAVPNRVPVQVSDGGAEVVDQVTPARAPATATAPLADTQPPGQAGVQPQSQAARERDSAAFAPPVDRRGQRKTEALEKDSPPAEAKANALAETATPMPAAPPAGAAAAPPFAPPALPQSADSNLRRAAPAASARVSTFANAPETIIVSSNPATRFRLLRGGGVQRSADAGATWRTEVTGATETLAAGASPSPSVCWVVGPSGTVLLSTDGRSWRRIRFPEAVDLQAVTASDHENATVTTADGRSFVTTDGGQTWLRTPAL